MIENPCLAISTPDLQKKLESFKDLPCYLLPIQANEENKVDIKCVFLGFMTLHVIFI